MSESTAPSILPDLAAGDRRPDALRLLIVLPTLAPYGGVVSVVNLANLLVDGGDVVRIVSLRRERSDLVHPRTEPLLVVDPERIAEAVSSDFDVVMATSWQTVDPSVQAAASMGATPVYFVQDFEPDFYEEGDRQDRARATYDRIDHRIVKTRYLEERLLDEGGWATHRISPGMDLDVFYPRVPYKARERPVVLAHARPGTPADHRGFAMLVEVYAELHRRRPVDLVVFGSSQAELFDCPVRAVGRVDPTLLPDLYSQARVFVDTSRRHGFGRTGVEALACGTPCVLTDSGGIDEYAVDGENSLVVPVDHVSGAAGAVERVLDDPDLGQRLATHGRAGVMRFDDRAAAAELRTLLAGLRAVS